MPTSRAGSRSSCRTGPCRSRWSAGSATGRSRDRSTSTRDGGRDPAGPATGARGWPGRSGLDRGRLPCPLHLADVGAAPGPGRGRGHRQPAGDPVGRPPHERRGPPGRRRRRPDRPAHGRHGQREPSEHARPYRPARGVGRRSCRWRARARPRPDSATRSPASSPTGPMPRASRAAWPSPSISRCPTPRSPPTSSRARSTRSRCRPSPPTSTGRRSASGTASSTAATGCPSSAARTRCRPRSRSVPSGPTPAWTWRAGLVRDLGRRGAGGKDVRVVGGVHRP